MLKRIIEAKLYSTVAKIKLKLTLAKQIIQLAKQLKLANPLHIKVIKTDAEVCSTDSEAKMS